MHWIMSNIFLDTQSEIIKDKYIKLIKIMGSLSRLYSQSNVPYLNYRVSENLFCRSFQAKNLSRSDISADASLRHIPPKSAFEYVIENFEKPGEGEEFIRYKIGDDLGIILDIE